MERLADHIQKWLDSQFPHDAKLIDAIFQCPQNVAGTSVLDEIQNAIEAKGLTFGPSFVAKVLTPLREVRRWYLDRTFARLNDDDTDDNTYRYADLYESVQVASQTLRQWAGCMRPAAELPPTPPSAPPVPTPAPASPAIVSTTIKPPPRAKKRYKRSDADYLCEINALPDGLDDPIEQASAIMRIDRSTLSRAIKDRPVVRAAWAMRFPEPATDDGREQNHQRSARTKRDRKRNQG